MPSGALIVAVFEFVLLLFSLCVHECAHAWMASRLGDQTAREMGRVSLNPMDHIDPIGTLLFPALMIFGPLFGLTLFGGMLIGWAKPTPVITRNFRRIVRDDNLTTLAGPVSNLLIVIAAMIVLAIISVAVPDGSQYVYYAFHGSLLVGVSSGVQTVVLLATLAILVNLSLFFFNLLPIPPLDGSHLLRNALPYNAVQTYDRIPIWASYLLMMILGPVILGMLLTPSLGLVYLALRHI
ncbi:MAG: site-2 protease family protein [Terracidiphilus sp.]